MSFSSVENHVERDKCSDKFIPTTPKWPLENAIHQIIDSIIITLTGKLFGVLPYHIKCASQDKTS